MNSYSLWEEPWIPVISSSGEGGFRSIRDILCEAHTIREVFDPSPLITVSVHRLLIAVIYRVYCPKNATDWADLWRKGRLSPEPLDVYGAIWADRFDLLDPQRPFYQVPEIADEKVHPAGALVIESASGNNPTLFDHGLLEGKTSLPLDRAACHLVAHQQFAIGGGVSKPFNRMDGPLTKGLIVEASGRNLFETLLLNTLPLDRWTFMPNSKRDCPFWEIDNPPEPERKGTVPNGPMHYLTWQSRQLHLVYDESAWEVVGCQIRQRYCLPQDGSRIDPGKAYRKDNKLGWVPFRIDKQRAAWQFTHVLLQRETEERTCPHVTDWLAHIEAIANDSDIDIPPVIGMHVSGLTTDPKKAAKVDLWRREQFPIPVELLADPSLCGDLADLIADARRVESVLQRTAQALIWALGEPNQLPQAISYIWTGHVTGGQENDWAKNLSRSHGMVTRFWPTLEEPFRLMLGDLTTTNFVDVREKWRSALQSSAYRAFQVDRDSFQESYLAYEILSQIEHAFRARLASIHSNRNEGVAGNDEEPNE